MKYIIKYLIEINAFYDNEEIYDISDHEINNNEIELEIYKSTLDFISKRNYCRILKNNKLYLGLSEEDLQKLKKKLSMQYEYYKNVNNIKTIKEIIIESIIE